MTTLVIDRQTLPEAILPFISSPRIAVSAEPDRVVLSPATDENAYINGPDNDCIDPADYDDDTDYLCAIPGLVERFRAYRNLPDSAFTPVPSEYFNA
jgi:hypothetical protein